MYKTNELQQQVGSPRLDNNRGVSHKTHTTTIAGDLDVGSHKDISRTLGPESDKDNNEIEKARTCLPQLDESRADEYNDWLKVGMVLHRCGCEVDDWDEWSKKSEKYEPGVCEDKWESFSEDGNGEVVTLGTLFQMVREDGGVLPDDNGETEPDSVEIPSPGEDWRENDLKRYIETLFTEDEIVPYLTEASYDKKHDKWKPAKQGIYNLTARQILENLQNAEDTAEAVGGCRPEAGAWIRVNPFDGQGVKNENVVAYRHTLLESDGVPLEQQYAIYRKLRVPVAALVMSGDKSLHAIVRINAENKQDYKKRVQYLYKVAEKYGLPVDHNNKNESRLSRMPGVLRNGRPQYLVGLDMGKESWDAWMAYRRQIDGGEKDAGQSADTTATEDEIRALASEVNYYLDRDHNGEMRSYARPYHQTIERVVKLTRNRIVNLDGQMVALPEKAAGRLSHLESADQLFAWIGNINETSVDIKRDLQGAMSRGEIFAQLKEHVPRVQGIECAPEIPPREDFVYNHEPLPEPDYDALYGLIGFFCPASDVDHYLLLAFFVTALWGCPRAQKPPHLIHSKEGRSVGKSRPPYMAAYLLGQTPISGSTKDQTGQIKSRILSPAARQKRIVLYDNEVGRLNSPELSEMITADVISGHRLYSGEGERVNNLCFVITLNTESGDSDMASRAVTIQLARPHYDPEWENRVKSHIDAYRNSIWAAIADILQQEPADIHVKTRWPTWERDVLSRLPGVNVVEVQNVLAERQQALDDEAEEANLIIEGVEQTIQSNNGDPQKDCYFIKNRDMTTLVNRVLNKNLGVVTAGKIVNTLIENGRAPNMKQGKHGKHGRGFYWTGPEYAEKSGGAQLLCLAPGPGSGWGMHGRGNI